MSKNTFHSPNKENIMVSFSGGRTSAYMCWWLITYMSHLYNFHFVFANTGLEHEKTLEFVNKVDKYLGLNLTWIEAAINPIKSIGTHYTIVDYITACRDVRLFDEMCAVYGLPNSTWMHCTRELKIQPIKKFADDYFGVIIEGKKKNRNYRQAIGIRHDEMSRIQSLDPIKTYPLIFMSPTTKEDVLDFWSKQPFDLEIEEHYGNCVGCFKKSDKKYKMIADENPHYFDPFIFLENKHAYLRTPKEKKDGVEKRIIYRHYRTAYEVKHNLNLPDTLSEAEKCAEECGTIDPNFESIVVEELNLFDFANNKLN